MSSKFPWSGTGATSCSLSMASLRLAAEVIVSFLSGVLMDNLNDG